MMPLALLDHLEFLQVPQSQAVIQPGRDKLFALGSDGESAHFFGVPLQGASDSGTRNIPDANDLVRPRGEEQLAIGTVSEGGDGIRMTKAPGAEPGDGTDRKRLAVDVLSRRFFGVERKPTEKDQQKRTGDGHDAALPREVMLSVSIEGSGRARETG